MRWLRLRRRRARENKAAADRLAEAEREVEVSRRRLRETRERVVKPLRTYADQNHFAELIRASLAEGRRGRAAG